MEKQIGFLCPECRTALTNFSLSSWDTVHLCDKCKGTWYSLPVLLRELGLSPRTHLAAQKKDNSSSLCPSCPTASLSVMETPQSRDILLCESCRGIWLRPGQIREMRQEFAQTLGSQLVKEEITRTPWLVLDENLSRTERLFGIPLLLIFSFLLTFTPLGEILHPLVNIRFHEAGHALMAWLDSRKATPLGLILPIFPWTNFSEPSFLTGVFIVFLLGLGFYRNYQSKKLFLVITFLLLLGLWGYITFFIPETKALSWIAWAGVGGEFILSTWLIISFYFHLSNAYYWGFLRWALGLIASLSLVTSIKMWFGIHYRAKPLPMGTAWNGAGDGGGDMNLLLADYLWSVRDISQSYVSLGFICLGIWAVTHLAVYIFSELRATKS